MEKRHVTIKGDSVRGTVVNATVLRDLLTLIVDGSQRAVRLRTQGRSTARGTPPAWIPAAADFSVEIKEGSTVLEIDAPTLFSVDPEQFSQRSMFPDIDPLRTSFDYFADSLSAAVSGGEDTESLDSSMLNFLTDLEDVFQHGISSVEFDRSHPGMAPLVVRERDIAGIAEMERQIPPPQQARVAGTLDLIRHSDGTFYLLLPNNEKVKGIATSDQLKSLQDHWGQAALVTGVVHFNPSGRVLRLEAATIRQADTKDSQLWAFAPEPLVSSAADFRTPQGPRSGLNAIFGQWPGDESDADIDDALRAMS